MIFLFGLFVFVFFRTQNSYVMGACKMSFCVYLASKSKLQLSECRHRDWTVSSEKCCERWHRVTSFVGRKYYNIFNKATLYYSTLDTHCQYGFPHSPGRPIQSILPQSHYWLRRADKSICTPFYWLHEITLILRWAESWIGRRNKCKTHQIVFKREIIVNITFDTVISIESQGAVLAACGRIEPIRDFPIIL